MAIYLGGETAAAKPKLDDLTPRQIVEELDRYVVGQTDAKRAVAVALRNRVRRQKLPTEIAEDVQPKNILMIGTTGVGKTEIARRLARIADSPFIKIEASKFTEVGYVGRDVESMIRELTDVAVDLARQAAYEDVKPRAEENTEETLLDLLLPPVPMSYSNIDNIGPGDEPPQNKTREKLREQLRRGDLDDRLIELDTQERPSAQIDFVAGQGMEEMGVNLKDMLGNMFPTKTVRRKMKVAEARTYLLREEQENLVDTEQITRDAIKKTQDSGIVFLDEIDKVAGRETGSGGPEVSREGVQRDLLPIVEGTNVNTRYGMVNTEHILFIAAGAFHVAKPSDLIPELQGRFPIRVELESLTIDDLKRILTQPKNSLIKQYQALLSTEGIELEFTEDAISRLAELTAEINKTTENIGARRLHTLLEKLLEEISFAGGELEKKHQIIDAEYVSERLNTIIQDQNLRQYIL
ncbi:MAG: ATP-dependent protease ATPase subunit HslU [Pyrinomonadaceae bacterium]